MTFTLTSRGFFAELHAINSRITCNPVKIRCMGPLHHYLSKSCRKSLKCSLHWNWLVFKRINLASLTNKPAERCIAPSGAFQILKHVCICVCVCVRRVQPRANLRNILNCQKACARSIIPRASYEYRQHPGNPLDVCQ